MEGLSILPSKTRRYKRPNQATTCSTSTASPDRLVAARQELTSAGTMNNLLGATALFGDKG